MKDDNFISEAPGQILHMGRGEETDSQSNSGEHILSVAVRWAQECNTLVFYTCVIRTSSNGFKLVTELEWAAGCKYSFMTDSAALLGDTGHVY